MTPKITWPEGKRFAFTVFDDTDEATLGNVGPVYSLLNECGLRVTKSCWPVPADRNVKNGKSHTCEDRDYVEWLLRLQSQGFEIGWHNSSWQGLPRPQIIAAMKKFAEIFGQYPRTGANHSDDESIYWGDARLSGWRALVYNLTTAYRNHGRFRGHIEGDRCFWGDLCRDRIKYFRNFVFKDINTLAYCPFMPYHDPTKPYVHGWFASSNGSNVRDFNRCISEANQDRLEEEGGVCIMYTHFAYGFVGDAGLDPRFASLMKRLSRKDGWFVPVGTLLDYLEQTQGLHEITPAQRRHLERKWLLQRLVTDPH